MICYFMVIIGTFVDFTTTHIALRNPLVYETNPFTRLLIATGQHAQFDILIVFLSIFVPMVMLRISHYPPLRAILLYPLILGLGRLAAGLWNFSLI